MRVSIIVALLMPLCAVAQTSAINQLDSLGKRHGRWLIYLDYRGEKVADSTQAMYSRYTYYDHGVHLRPMGRFIGKKGHVLAPDRGFLKLMDGTYKGLDERGEVQYVHHFERGEYVYYKEFYPTGELKAHFDYTRHAKDQPLSYYYVEYDKKGNIRNEGYMMKDSTGRWPKTRG